MSSQSKVWSTEDLPAPQSIKALLLDDSNFDRARIRRLSDRTRLPIQLDEVGSIEEMDNAVRSSSYDLIMIDYRLPVGDGLAALEHIQHDPLNSGAGTIMITGDAGLDTAVIAMRRGCHDFLSKDAMTADQLKTAMMSAIATATQRRAIAHEASLQREIITNGLTAALMSEEVQVAVIALMKQHFNGASMQPQSLWVMPDPYEIEELITSLREEDEFIFH